MNDNVRYLWNWGLAFDEDRLLKKLVLMAKEGWMLDRMTTLRYRLVKTEPQNLCYAMDYKKVKPEEEAEYLAVLSESDWKHACSMQGFHFFFAKSETVPIYTDQVSKIEKYSGYKRASFLVMLILVLLFGVLFGLDQLNSFAFLGSSERLVFPFLLAASGAVFIHAGMMSLAYAKVVKDIETEDR